MPVQVSFSKKDVKLTRFDIENPLDELHKKRHTENIKKIMRENERSGD